MADGAREKVMGGLLTACQAIMSSHFGAGYASNVSRDPLAPNPQGDIQPGQTPYLWVIEETDAEMVGDLANGLAFLSVRVTLYGVVLKTSTIVNTALQTTLNNWQGALLTAIFGPQTLGGIAAEVLPGGSPRTYTGADGGALDVPLLVRFNIYAT